MDDIPLLSDVHIGVNQLTRGSCVVSRFEIDIPFLRKQSQDDEKTHTRRGREKGRRCLTVVHTLETPLRLVGTQVWGAAFLLADFFLSHAAQFSNCTAVELGAGPGVAGLTLSLIAKRCYLTDHATEVLDILSRNVEANRHLFLQDKHYSGLYSLGITSKEDSVAIVRKLDWFDADPFSRVDSNYSWSDDDKDHVRALDFIVASDVIYDEESTAALFSMLRIISKLQSKSRPQLVIYLAIEKRFNFSLVELSVAATGYRTMLSHLNIGENKSTSLFSGRRLDTDFRQHFKYYRSPQMELWKFNT